MRFNPNNYRVCADTGCWVWQGAKDRDGYGLCRGAGSRHAHRVQYILRHGPIPAGLQLDHLCRNTSCVNPDHLEPVSLTENVRRSRVAKLHVSDIKTIRERFAAGEKQIDIAPTVGVDSRTISRIIRGVLWVDAGGPISTDNTRTVISIGQVKEIRRLHKSGESGEAIASLFRVSTSQISRIITGRSRKQG